MDRSYVRIREVGPREGLQADPQVVDTDLKVRMLQMLLEAGVRDVNAIALVHPKAMPQMADAEEVLERLGPVDAVVSALTPNEKAVERALPLAQRGLLDKVFFVHGMTQVVLEANGIRMPVDEHLDHLLRLAARAKEEGDLQVGLFLSASFGCSVEGEVAVERVVANAERIVAAPEVDDLVVSDSTGQADPLQVERLLEALAPVVGDHPLTLHLHDSRGAGTANVLAAVRSDIPNLTLDTAFGGLGGDVPFLPQAAGNVATEDVCEMLHGMGISTGIDVAGVIEVSRALQEATGRHIISRVFTVGPISWKPVPVG